MNDTADPRKPSDGLDWAGERRVGGPVDIAWREGTLTRAKELEALCAWVLIQGQREDRNVLANAVSRHISAAREAAVGARSQPSRRWRLSLFRDASLRERATGNLDAAEAQILNIASADYVLGQVPGVLRHVRDHLVPGNPQRLSSSASPGSSV